MAPKAWPYGFLWRPVAGLDQSSAPAIFDHEARRRPRKEGCYVIVRVATESRADALRIGQCDVVGLPDIIKAEELDHHVVHAVLAGLDKGEAVMAWVDMAEIGAERLEDVVAQAEAQNIAIERQDVIGTLNRKHRMAHAERPRAKSRDAAARSKWLSTYLGTVKRLQPITNWIGEDDEILDAPLIGERATATRDRDAGAFEPRGY